jgi:Ca-activated chloride channel homolog
VTNYQRRPLWREPLFVKPLIFLALFLILTMLFWLFGFGRPNVAVTIALDLSNSTYNGSKFNAPGTIMAQEVTSVKAFLQENAKLRNPNRIQVMGFGGGVSPLTSDFQTNSQQVETELTEALNNPKLPQQVIPDRTDISAAIQKGTDNLQGVTNHCRELLLVTDGDAEVSPLAVSTAIANKVKINAVVVGGNSVALQAASMASGGIYLSGEVNNLDAFFTDKFFAKFNSNLGWVIFWLGAVWVALMWTVTLPLDRWILQGMMKMPMNLAGQLAIGNAFFWTAATPAIVWRLANGLPFLSQC